MNRTDWLAVLASAWDEGKKEYVGGHLQACAEAIVAKLAELDGNRACCLCCKPIADGTGAERYYCDDCERATPGKCEVDAPEAREAVASECKHDDYILVWREGEGEAVLDVYECLDCHATRRTGWLGEWLTPCKVGA
jgi:hypothetical protein